jgi:hypothetical protein
MRRSPIQPAISRLISTGPSPGPHDSPDIEFEVRFPHRRQCPLLFRASDAGPARRLGLAGCRRTRLVLLFEVGAEPPHDGIRGGVELSFGRPRCRLTAETAAVADSPIHRPRGDTGLPEQNSLERDRSGLNRDSGF